MSDPVITDLGRYLAAQGRDESLRLAIENEADMLLATPEGRLAAARRLIEEVESVGVSDELAQMLGDLIAAAKDGREVGRIDQLYPRICGWALAQVEKHAEEIVMKEAA